MDANCRFLFGHLVCWILLVEIGMKIIEAVQAIKQIVTQMKHGDAKPGTVNGAVDQKLSETRR